MLSIIIIIIDIVLFNFSMRLLCKLENNYSKKMNYNLIYAHKVTVSELKMKHKNVTNNNLVVMYRTS